MEKERKQTQILSFLVWVSLSEQ